MVKAKLMEDFGPRSHSSRPNHKAGTQVSTNHGYNNVCKHTYPPMHAYLACVEAEVMLGSFLHALWDL